MALFKLIRMQQANELQHAKAGQTMRSSIYGKVERGSAIERERERDLQHCRQRVAAAYVHLSKGGISEGIKGVDGRQQTLFSAFTD